MQLTRLLRSVPRQQRRGGVLTILAAGAIAVGPGVSTAQAQPWTPGFWKDVGVSVSFGRVQPADDNLDPIGKVGFSGGFFPKEGWGPAFGLGWFKTGVSVDGFAVGKLDAKPVLAGVGYTWVRDKLAINASVMAGIIFNRASVDRALLDQLGGPVSLDVDNSFALRPALGLQYSLFRKLAVKGTLSYLTAPPSIDITTPQGQRHSVWNASHGSFEVGLVFYPFR